MKIFKNLSILSTLLLLIVIQTGLSSCTKEVITKIIETDTIVTTDTIVKEDTALTIQILTTNSWKLKEVRGVVGGSKIYYLRGGPGSDNTESFDNEYITFKADKTGTLINNIGIVFQMKWDFTDLEHTKLSYTVYNSPATFIINWANIRYTNNSIYYDEYYTDGNTFKNAHSQQIRIPK